MLAIKLPIITALFFLVYGLVYYFAFSLQIRMDFASFYYAAQAYAQGDNPYIIFFSNYLTIPQALPRNLNPPFFLEVLQPLAQFDFLDAALIWSALSLLANCLGIGIVFKLTISDTFKKNGLIFFLTYFALYSTITNISLGQCSSFLLLLIMSGYYYYQKKNDYLTGICWGIAMSIKLFPGLLLLMVLKEKRYRVALIILSSCLLTILLPVFTHGIIVYKWYLTMLPNVAWYGSNWNASLCGFIYRLLYPLTDTMTTKAIVVIVFTMAIHWYLQQINYPEKARHHRFCFTLIMMLLLSPFGWMYYFALLLMPISLLIKRSINQPQSVLSVNMLLICLFLLNMPMPYLSPDKMTLGLIGKLSIYSSYFYGLLILAGFFKAKPASDNTLLISQSIIKSWLINGGLAIIAFGFILPLMMLILKIIYPLGV